MSPVIFFIDAKIHYSSSLPASTNLQKTILSASLLKHPTFSYELIERYIEFTNQLTTRTAKSTKPIRITTFQSNDFDLQSIDKDGIFKPIEIANAKTQTNLLESNVQLLAHVISEIIDLQKPLIVHCTQCILNAFHNAHIRVKSRCLRYFIRLLNHATQLNPAIQPIFVSILKGIEYFERVIPLWLHHKLVKASDIETFASLASDLLDNQNIYKLFDATQLKCAAQYCLSIIRTHGHKKVTAYDKVVTNAYKVVKAIAAEVNDASLHKEIVDFVRATVDDDELNGWHNITLLCSSVLDQMKRSQVISWTLVDRRLADIQSDENVSNAIVIDQLQCLCSILKSARYVEYYMAVYLQRRRCDDMKDTENGRELLANLRHINKSFTEKLPRQLLDTLPAVCGHVLKRFNSLLTTRFSPLVDTSTLLLFADIAIAMLSLSNAQDIDSYIQLQLLLITLCPFVRCSELLFNHLQQAFETETQRITKIMDSPFVPNQVNVSWLELALQTIININLGNVSTENKEIFLDIFVQIAGNLNQPDCLQRIITVLIGCAVQVDTYGVGDLEKFLEMVARDDRNQAVVSNNLKQFYCLASGQTFIVQTNKDDDYRFKIVCPLCYSDARNACENAGSVKSLLAKAPGRFVRTLTTAHAVNTVQHTGYFRMFTSPEQKIRENMTFCLSAILNHLDLNLYENSTDFWLHPIVDREMNIRLWMIKHIHIIPQRASESIRMKCFQKLLECTKTFLSSDHKSDQSSVLSLISSFATAPGISESLLLKCFRLTLYFCICTRSMVSRQAALCANEMCSEFGITPANILTWNKTEMCTFIISLCVSNYVKDNVGLQKSLHSVSCLFFKR